MAKSRLVLHPLLAHKRSRFILTLFLVISGIVGAVSWMRLESALKAVGVSRVFGPPSGGMVITLLLSTYTRMALIVASGIFAAGITAHHVIGPIKRIEQWLIEMESGRPMAPLKVRTGDKFTKLVDLINRLYQSN